MKFDQKKNGSCDICFTDEEIEILKRKRKLHLSAEGLRHFGNCLVRIVGEFQVNFDKDRLNNESSDLIAGVVIAIRM